MIEKAVILTCILLSITSVIDCKRGWDNSFCTQASVQPPPGVIQKPRTNITYDKSGFGVHVECSFTDKNQSIDVDEWFDVAGKRGRISLLQDNANLDAWYYFDTNEYIFYLPALGQCGVEDLHSSKEQFIIGKGSGNKAFSVAEALHLSVPGEVYMGTTSIRGIDVDVFRSCQYIDFYDATVLVDYYFTSPAEWITELGQPVPVGIKVTGRVYDTDTTFRKIEHHYDLFHYHPGDLYHQDEYARVYETPSEVQCPGRKNQKKLPDVNDLPTSFSMDVENLDRTLNSIGYQQEWYNSPNKLVRYTYTTNGDLSPYGQAYLMEVHDFNTGVAYITDLTRGNCSVVPIEQNFDTTIDSARNLRLRKMTEFFSFNVANYTYEGVKTIRGVQSDTWVGHNPNFPAVFGSNWQWSFAKSDWYTDKAKNIPIPVQLRVENHDIGVNLEYNVFNFEPSDPSSLLQYDISACFQNKHGRIFQMTFPGKYTKQLQNESIFKYNFQTYLANKLQISVLRVANIRLTVGNDIYLEFEILDVAPIPGDTGAHSKETSLSAAVSTLKSAFKNNEIFVRLGSDKQAQGIAPVANTLTETTFADQSTSGYSPGVMAAVAVPVSIVCAVMGIVAAWFFFKKK